MRRMTLVAAVVALLAGAAMLLVATGVAADDNDGDGDEDEVRLDYVDEWLDGTLVNCEPASISYGYELDGEVCDVEDGPWSDELETLLGDLDRDKDRERVADLVYELLVADAECDGLNSVDHVRGTIVDPRAEKKCLRNTVVTETDALSCAGKVVVALGEGSASERRGRLHDMLFMPEEDERPACGQPRSNRNAAQSADDSAAHAAAAYDHHDRAAAAYDHHRPRRRRLRPPRPSPQWIASPTPRRRSQRRPGGPATVTDGRINCTR